MVIGFFVFLVDFFWFWIKLQTIKMLAVSLFNLFTLYFNKQDGWKENKHKPFY